MFSCLKQAFALLSTDDVTFNILLLIAKKFYAKEKHRKTGQIKLCTLHSVRKTKLQLNGIISKCTDISRSWKGEKNAWMAKKCFVFRSSVFMPKRKMCRSFRVFMNRGRKHSRHPSPTTILQPHDSQTSSLVCGQTQKRRSLHKRDQ